MAVACCLTIAGLLNAADSSNAEYTPQSTDYDDEDYAGNYYQNNGGDYGQDYEFRRQLRKECNEECNENN